MINGTLYQALIVFHAIVETGGISAAARKLSSSPPAVSQALKQLENHLGLPLMLRSTRKLELTDAGRQLYRHTKLLCGELDEQLDSVRSMGNVPSGSVRMTVPRFMFRAFLQPIYAEFCELYPDIQLEISLSDAAVDIVKEGFDVGIRCGDILADGMVAHELLPMMKDYLLISPGYAKRYGIPKKPAELIRHKMIGYRLITANRIQPLYLNDKGRQIEIKMPISLIVDDELDLMLDATRQGLGIGRVFEASFKMQPDQDFFIPILQKYWIDYPPIYLYFAQHSQKAKRVRVLIDFLLAKRDELHLPFGQC